ncbi:MAG: hypothetical protein HYY90_06995 [Candidatus Omnitrophica bacterium]|nr:hypothetical protein [Candidatus Omnitrophota bacterium]
MMGPVLIDDEVTGISQTEREREWRPRTHTLLHRERREKLSESESLPLTIARLAGWIIAIYLIMQSLGQLPTPYPQEDLPGKYPLGIRQQVFNPSAANMVSGTWVIFDRGE